LWVALAVLAIAVAAGVLLTHPFSRPSANQAASAGTSSAAPAGTVSAAGPGTPATGTPSAGTGSPSPAAAERQAAASVAGLLGRSVADRAAISGAAADIDRCGPQLAADPTVFDDAVASRKSLLASLSALPGRAALPAALVTDLTGAWQASISADQAYATWARDEIAKGCKAGDTSDPGYQAAQAPDIAATKDKTAFTSAWNPVAARYGLTPYQPGQL
jgi:hypothetical protein